MDRSEFQQDSVLKQLEVLKEEEKEFQNLKVGVATDGRTRHGIWSSAGMAQPLCPDKQQQQIEEKGQKSPYPLPKMEPFPAKTPAVRPKKARGLQSGSHSSPLPQPVHRQT